MPAQSGLGLGHRVKLTARGAFQLGGEVERKLGFSALVGVRVSGMVGLILGTAFALSFRTVARFETLHD